MIVLPGPEIVLDGLNLPECPRWHDGALYFSDIAAGRVCRLGAEDRAELLYEDGGDFTGGLGFLEDGDLVTVLSKQRRLLRIGRGGNAVHADLSGLCRFVLNDMAMHGGRAYVSQPGFDIWADELRAMPDPTDLIVVHPDGSAAIAASDMMSPNGMAISPDGRTLYVAESTGMRITCFDIDPASGALSNRRLFATLPDGGLPDGICLDDQGAVWAAVPVAVTPTSYGTGPGVIRLVEGGEATHVVPVGEGRRALACAFGGADRASLHICTVPDFEGVAALSAGQGRLERMSPGFRGCA